MRGKVYPLKTVPSVRTTALCSPGERQHRRSGLGASPKECKGRSRPLKADSRHLPQKGSEQVCEEVAVSCGTVGPFCAPRLSGACTEPEPWISFGPEHRSGEGDDHALQHGADCGPLGACMITSPRIVQRFKDLPAVGLRVQAETRTYRTCLSRVPGRLHPFDPRPSRPTGTRTIHCQQSLV